jgi:hypothetical protein
MALIDIEKKLMRVGETMYAGIRVAKCLNTEAATYMGSLWGSVFPGASMAYAPCCMKVEIDYNARAIQGEAILYIRYETLRNTTTARVCARGGTKAVRLQYDINGDVIKGPDPTDARNEWYLLEGSPVVEEGATELIIQTARQKSSFQIAWLDQFIGTLNNGAFPSLGLSAGQGKFTGFSRAPGDFGTDLAYLDYHIALCWDGWNNETVRRKGAHYVQRIPVYDENNEAVLEGSNPVTRDVKLFLPGYSWSGSSISASAAAAGVPKYTSTGWTFLQGLTYI